MGEIRKKGIQVQFTHSGICFVEYSARLLPVDFRVMFEDMRAGRTIGQEYGLLVDMRLFNPVTANSAIRKEVTRLAQESLEPGGKFVCEARILTGGFARRIVSAFDRIDPPAWQRKNFSKTQAAETWVRSQLQTAGVEISQERIWPL